MSKPCCMWLLSLIAAAASGGAMPQDYPVRPIQFVIATSPGGIVDVLGRTLAEGMAKQLGQAVVPMNRDGAANTIAAGFVAQSKPDGYTLGFSAAGPFVSQPYLKRDLPFKNSDFEFLCQAFELQVAIVVRPESPIRSLADLIDTVKREPGKLNVGHAGAASIPHVALSQLEALAGFKLDYLNYKGDGEVVKNLLGGHIDVAAPGLGTVGKQNLRVLAIFGRERVAAHPDVPTVKELGYPIVKTGMVGLFSPKGLPAAVRGKLVSACKTGVESENYRMVSQRMNQSTGYLAPAEWEKHLDEDARDNKAVIERLGIKQ